MPISRRSLILAGLAAPSLSRPPGRLLPRRRCHGACIPRSGYDSTAEWGGRSHHARDGGEYDNTGFQLRGHVFTDDQGRYAIKTVVPGPYPGRTRHIHVKVQPPNGQLLTTQLYFPGEPGNARDGIYRKECELTMGAATGADGKQASFTFVLQA